MNPDLTVFLVGLAMLAIGIIGTDWLIHRPARIAHRASMQAWSEYHQREQNRLRTMLASAESDVEWARIVLADVARERDMFEAAFTAEMLRQARAELLRPDEASGLATVHEIKAGRA